eukprot:PLAT12970.1.p1 GENE.PLAT12970.1~~PLAT12970.1.p1  ORF type:complete len:638 (+),score=291.60 PLAT12970.1:58-1971(+)
MSSLPRALLLAAGVGGAALLLASAMPADWKQQLLRASGLLSSADAADAAAATRRRRRREAEAAAAARLLAGDGSEAGELPAPAVLREHSSEFGDPTVERVCEGVYVAIGYGLANSIMLVGTTGVVIVDAMESVEAARPVAEAFLEIAGDLPLVAIVYTHNHADHVFGASEFVRVWTAAAEAAGRTADDVSVISHGLTAALLRRVLGVTNKTTHRRAARQFGTALAEDFINCGIGPRLAYDGSSTTGVLWPTVTFDGERMDIELAGLQLTLLHMPGETDDQISVWLPKARVLLPGDNIYRAFPNLYAIRGTASRDVVGWVASLERMRQLRAAYMVPSHTRPVCGDEQIAELLTTYRDAISFVHDQTVRWMNRGLHPDDIVQRVVLPAHLAEHPYLAELYGTVAWSVRGIFASYVGWFSGFARDLRPMAPREHGLAMLELAGGGAALLSSAEDALADGRLQWALQLADALLLAGAGGSAAARKIKVAALRGLASLETSAGGRNYYLTQAAEEGGGLLLKPSALQRQSFVDRAPMELLFAAMAVNLDAQAAAEVEETACFSFPDADEHWTLAVRRGVCEVKSGFPTEPPTLSLTADSRTWRDIIARRTHIVKSYAAGELAITGGTVKMAKFLSLFQDREA